MRIFNAFLMVIALAACSSTQHGTFIKGGFQQATVTTDVLQRLGELYPPAKTTFALTHDVPPEDTFGVMLLDEMRRLGYAIQDFSPKSEQPEINGKTFGYVLDEMGEIYRVTLEIDGKSLSRAYVSESGSLVPSGPWSLKE